MLNVMKSSKHPPNDGCATYSRNSGESRRVSHFIHNPLLQIPGQVPTELNKAILQDHGAPARDGAATTVKSKAAEDATTRHRRPRRPTDHATETGEATLNEARRGVGNKAIVEALQIDTPIMQTITTVESRTPGETTILIYHHQWFSGSMWSSAGGCGLTSTSVFAGGLRVPAHLLKAISDGFRVQPPCVSGHLLQYSSTKKA